MRVLLVVDRCAADSTAAVGVTSVTGLAGVTGATGVADAAGEATPQAKRKLEAFGYSVLYAGDERQTELHVGRAEAIVVHAPLDEINQWSGTLLKGRTVPMLWWCSAVAAARSSAFCENDAAIDGILTPSMSEPEVHWALLLSSRQCVQRLQWLSERKQLESRLEERKWIDMAKGILCKMKHISEAEAYEFLRKQAMNERKRMVDVATSIVKVHNILQGQK